MQLKIGYLFQCPPWARSFCPFRASGRLADSLFRPRLAQVFEDGGYLAGREILATILVA